MQGDYDDIINLPHHQSDRRPHMSLYDRAAQFAPFSALTPDNAMWHRNDAFESCAGLTELILEPFHAKYMCADGTVLVQFRTTKDGTVQMSASVVEK